MNTNAADLLLLYNLHPGLAGPLREWPGHMDRAVDLGFEWLLVNPIQQPGDSGSLYALSDPLRVNRALLDPDDERSGWDQLAASVDAAHDRGLKVMFDLVVNHCAIDSPLVAEHPAWFRWTEAGELVHPSVWRGDRLLHEWVDLVEVANVLSSDRDSLWTFWTRVIDRLLDAGADGLRAHMAHQAPLPLWHRLLAHARRTRPEALFVAETLGCPDWQVLEVARLPFDACFNSSKWWDFQQSWCLDQYRALAHRTRTISFPEHHDTQRLMDELGGDVDAVRLRYLFAALFTSGVMMPLGFEFGFRRPLETTTQLDATVERPPMRPFERGEDDAPDDFDAPREDLRDFIRATNRVKRSWRVFREDNAIERLNQPSSSVVVLRKESLDGRQRGLIVLNSDRRDAAPVLLGDIPAILGTATATEITPGRVPAPAVRLVEEIAPSGFHVFVGDLT